MQDETRDVNDVEQTVAAVGPAPIDSDLDNLSGDMVGNYRLLDILGKGGMGVVYEAEQQNPRRKVALKIIRGRHRADEFHVRMFHREAELLGRLKHPNIAAIYESGHTDDGRHYFAMELARGETLGLYCRRLDSPPEEGTRSKTQENQSPTSETALNRDEVVFRLRIFLKICDAVSYAHQRGIIHRDLKPANVVIRDRSIETHEGSLAESVSGSSISGTSLSTSSRDSDLPGVKVLDFGLARIIDPEDEDATMLTQVGTVKGTPAYMSPEAAGGNPDETDLRADIYGLGVILYELLAGVRPLDIENASFLDALQIIRDADPMPLREASGRTQRIDADLETVVHKALEKDRERRYQSVAGFAMDIERFINHEPVLASPPSATYRLRKLVRRHRSMFAAMGAVAVILIGATVVSTTMFFEAQRESARARTEANKSEQIAAFLTEMLQGVGPAVAKGRDTQMLREILDHTAERIGVELVDQPEVEGTLRTVVGTTYRELGEYEAAEPHLLTALEIRRRTHGPEAPATLQALTEIAGLNYYLGRMAEAESLYTWAGEHLTSTVGPEDLRTLNAWAGQILIYTYQGKLDEATSLGETIVPVLRRSQGDGNSVTQSAMFHLAQNYADQLRYDDSETLFLELIKITEREHGPDYPFAMSSRASLGWLYRLDMRLDEAENLTSTALADMRRVLGNDHSETLVAVNNLAIIYKDLGRYDEAEPLYLESLESGIRIMGESHPENLPSMVNMASFYQTQGRWNDAYDMADRALDIFTSVMPEGHIGIAFAYMTRGFSLLEQQNLTEAEADLLVAHDFMSRFFEPDHRHLMKVCGKLALICEQQNRLEEADRWRKMSQVENADASG